MTQNNNFMSLYGFVLVISGLRRILFDTSSHPKIIENTCCLKKKKKNTANWVVVLSPYWIRPGKNLKIDLQGELNKVIAITLTICISSTQLDFLILLFIKKMPTITIMSQKFCKPSIKFFCKNFCILISTKHNWYKMLSKSKWKRCNIIM